MLGATFNVAQLVWHSELAGSQTCAHLAIFSQPDHMVYNQRGAEDQHSLHRVAILAVRGCIKGAFKFGLECWNALLRGHEAKKKPPRQYPRLQAQLLLVPEERTSVLHMGWRWQHLPQILRSSLPGTPTRQRGCPPCGTRRTVPGTRGRRREGQFIRANHSEILTGRGCPTCHHTGACFSGKFARGWGGDKLASRPHLRIPQELDVLFIFWRCRRLCIQLQIQDFEDAYLWGIHFGSILQNGDKRPAIRRQRRGSR